MIVISAKYKSKRPADVSRGKFNEIMRWAFRMVGLYWIATYLAKHFAIGAGEKYRYRLRGAKYRQRKDERMRKGQPFKPGDDLPVIGGSNRPNVLTGYAMREIQSHTVVRGFPSRATVYLYGPSYFLMRYRMNQPNKGKEITTVLPAEKKDISRVLRGAVLKKLAEHRGQRSQGV